MKISGAVKPVALVTSLLVTACAEVTSNAPVTTLTDSGCDVYFPQTGTDMFVNMRPDPYKGMNPFDVSISGVFSTPVMVRQDNSLAAYTFINGSNRDLLVGLAEKGRANCAPMFGYRYDFNYN